MWCCIWAYLLCHSCSEKGRVKRTTKGRIERTILGMCCRHLIIIITMWIGPSLKQYLGQKYFVNSLPKVNNYFWKGFIWLGGPRPMALYLRPLLYFGKYCKTAKLLSSSPNLDCLAKNSTICYCRIVAIGLNEPFLQSPHIFVLETYMLLAEVRVQEHWRA